MFQAAQNLSEAEVETLEGAPIQKSSEIPEHTNEFIAVWRL
jgi:hypothetical protein